MEKNIKENIKNFRNQIDDIDNKIMELLVKRFSIASKIGEIKNINKLKITNQNREEEIINRLSKEYIGALNKNQIISIYSPIFSISKQIQNI